MYKRGCNAAGFSYGEDVYIVRCKLYIYEISNK